MTITPAKTARFFTGAVVLAAVLAGPGCVTINIYFPAAAAEKAADRIIDQVWQLKGDAEPQVKEPGSAPGEKK